MIEIFTTNIQDKAQAKAIQRILKNSFMELKINFDLENSNNTYPCGHSIMRVEVRIIIPESIITIINNQGFKCEILEDKICINKQNYDRILGRSF